MLNKSLTSVTLTALLTATPLAAQSSIESMAPENTVLLIGARNVNDMTGRCKQTGLWSLWENEEIQEKLKEVFGEFSDKLDEFYEELGVEEDSLVPPTGAAGAALFPVMNEELGTPQIGFLLFADYGENADKTHELVQAAFNHAREEGKAEFDEKDVLGRTVQVVEFVEQEDEAEEDVDFDDFEMDPMPLPGPEEVLGGVDSLFYVRDGNTLLISSDLAVMTDALAIRDGKSQGRLTNRTDFQTVMGKLGEVDIYAVLLTRDLMDLVSAADPMGMAMMMQPTLKAVFGDIKGVGYGARIGAPKAMTEQSMFLFMPNGTQGLTKLLNLPAQRAALPAFIGSDTVGYTRFSFRFSELMNVLRQIVMSNPMMAAEGEAMLASIEPTVTQLANSLGSQMHSVSSATKPITVESSSGILAVECTKPQEFENFITSIAAQAGIEQRDFLGQRIYRMDLTMLGAMIPGLQIPSLSLGISGGYVFVGPTPAVERALRAVGQKEAGALASNAAYRRATALLSNDEVVAWGYSSTIDSLETTVVAQKAAMKNMIEEMRQWSPESAVEMEAEMKQSFAVWDEIDFDLLREYVGPTAWQVASTDDGFVGRFYLLSAEEAEE